MICRKDKNRSCVKLKVDIYKSMYRKNKNRNLCQVGTLCQNQEFMPQLISFRLCLFYFYVYEIDFYTEIFALDLSSLLIVRTNNLAIL